MLRTVGILLAAFSALGVLLNILGMLQYFYLPSILGGLILTIFPASGLVCGLLLVRTKPTKRGSLFWVATLGACNCAPLAVFAGRTDGETWWPPKADIIYLSGLLSGPDFDLSPFFPISRFLTSWLLWADVPLTICLWAIWGRHGGWADKIFALTALLLAAPMAVLAAGTAYAELRYRRNPDFDYLYIPQPSWFVFYTIEILWLVALAMLLYRRQPKP